MYNEYSIFYGWMIIGIQSKNFKRKDCFKNVRHLLGRNFSSLNCMFFYN